MENLIKGIASFEGETSTNMIAYADPKSTWNGWARPFIHHHFVNELIQMLSHPGNTYTWENGSVRHVYENEYSILIEPQNIEGEFYYYFGNEGICFDFEPLKESERQQAIILDIDGLIYDDEEVENDPLKVGEIVYVNEYGYNEWQVYVESQSTSIIHGIDTDRIKLL
jgi:hypothetical protein